MRPGSPWSPRPRRRRRPTGPPDSATTRLWRSTSARRVSEFCAMEPAGEHARGVREVLTGLRRRRPRGAAHAHGAHSQGSECLRPGGALPHHPPPPGAARAGADVPGPARPRWPPRVRDHNCELTHLTRAPARARRPTTSCGWRTARTTSPTWTARPAPTTGSWATTSSRRPRPWRRARRRAARCRRAPRVGGGCSRARGASLQHLSPIHVIVRLFVQESAPKLI